MIELGHFVAARDAPGGPNIDENNFPFVVRKALRVSENIHGTERGRGDAMQGLVSGLFGAGDAIADGFCGKKEGENGEADPNLSGTGKRMLTAVLEDKPEREEKWYKHRGGRNRKPEEPIVFEIGAASCQSLID